MEKQYLDPYEAINAAYDELLAKEITPPKSSIIHQITGSPEFTAWIAARAPSQKPSRFLNYNSYILTRDHSEHFYEWFDPKTFDFNGAISGLIKYCYKYFDAWFDPKVINYAQMSGLLAACCYEHFDKWFDPKTFDFKYSTGALARNCTKHFEKWFDPETYNFKYFRRALEEHCKEYSAIWEPAYEKWTREYPIYNNTYND